MKRTYPGFVVTTLCAIAFFCLSAFGGCSSVSADQTQIIKQACGADIVIRPIAQTLVADYALTAGPQGVLYTAALQHLESDMDLVCANPDAAPSQNVLSMVQRDGPLVAQLVANLQAAKAGKAKPFPKWEADVLMAIPALATAVPPTVAASKAS